MCGHYPKNGSCDILRPATAVFRLIVCRVLVLLVIPYSLIQTLKHGGITYDSKSGVRGVEFSRGLDAALVESDLT